MNIPPDTLKAITRRHFFREAGIGVGAIALTSLLNNRLLAGPTEDPLAPKTPHFPPKAKNII